MRCAVSYVWYEHVAVCVRVCVRARIRITDVFACILKYSHVHMCTRKQDNDPQISGVGYVGYEGDAS